MTQEVTHSVLEGERLQPAQKLDDNLALSQEGKSMELILRSPMGLRAAFNLTRAELEIWISPQAKKSVDADLRNFSNRDDHTRIFDRIAFPGLDAGRFQRCAYDPFHSVLHFDQYAIHLVALVHQPGFVLWSEGKDLVVDLKTDKADTILNRAPHGFTTSHPDRGLTFNFAAITGPGSEFFHPPAAMLAPGRSTYARIELTAGQLMVIGGELSFERPEQVLASLAQRNIEDILQSNEAAVEEGTRFLRARFRGRPDWQRQYDLNLRVLYSAQDHGGWVPAAFRSLYYLCWHFDGSIISSWLGQLGWCDYLERWAGFQIANPTETETPVPGKFYGQLVTRRISRQEEWGWYCALWAAFAHYTQTGQTQFCEGALRDNLIAGFDWLERMCFDTEWGAFGVFYQGEDPFLGSHDYGIDAAVGKPMNVPTPSHQGKPIRRKFEYGNNQITYNGCWMLSVMLGDHPQADRFRKMAKTIEPFLQRCQREQVDSYFVLDGGEVAAEAGVPYDELSVFFHVAPEALPEMVRTHPIRQVKDLQEGQERFAHQMFQHFLALDPAIGGSDAVEAILEIFLPQCAREGRYLRMPGSVIENINCEDGSYHDNRPQIFATSLMNVSMLATGLRRQAFGYAVRANAFLEQIDNVQFRGQRLSFRFTGEGNQVAQIRAGGKQWRRTLQLPETIGEGDALEIEIAQTTEAPTAPVWIGSTVRLLECDESGAAPVWRFEAIGCNRICFLGGKPEGTLEQDGQPVTFTTIEANNAHYLSFEGRGRFSLRLAR